MGALGLGQNFIDAENLSVGLIKIVRQSLHHFITKLGYGNVWPFL